MQSGTQRSTARNLGACGGIIGDVPYPSRSPLIRHALRKQQTQALLNFAKGSKWERWVRGNNQERGTCLVNPPPFRSNGAGINGRLYKANIADLKQLDLCIDFEGCSYLVACGHRVLGLIDLTRLSIGD